MGNRKARNLDASSKKCLCAVRTIVKFTFCRLKLSRNSWRRQLSTTFRTTPASSIMQSPLKGNSPLIFYLLFHFFTYCYVNYTFTTRNNRSRTREKRVAESGPCHRHPSRSLSSCHHHHSLHVGVAQHRQRRRIPKIRFRYNFCPTPGKPSVLHSRPLSRLIGGPKQQLLLIEEGSIPRYRRGRNRQQEENARRR